MQLTKASKATLKSRKAFTLLELIAVIVIIGILAAIAVVGFSTVINNSRDDAHDADVAAVQSELQALQGFEYNTETGTYDPVDVADLSDSAQGIIFTAANGENSLTGDLVAADSEADTAGTTIYVVTNGIDTCFEMSETPTSGFEDC